MQKEIEIIIKTLGTPFSEKNFIHKRELKAFNLHNLFETAFENRVGLLFLEKLKGLNVDFDEYLQFEYESLWKRYRETQDVIKKLAINLNKVAPNQYSLFKSIKPFLSTPNDTDFFPLGDRKLHKRIVNFLLENGYFFLEEAPLQTTIIDSRGAGKVHSDKRGGTYYIDCYIEPGADYFIYFDNRKLAGYVMDYYIDDVPVKTLNYTADLAMVMYHSCFPEKTYTIETFYLILYFLKRIQEKEGSEGINSFVSFCRENHVTRAVKANITITILLHKKFFGFIPEVLEKLSKEFGYDEIEERTISKSNFSLPYNFTFRTFVITFFEKLKERKSFISFGNQLLHMLNPKFAYEVVTIIWKRSTGGGIYKQM